MPADANWSLPYSHRIETTGNGKITKPKRLAANHFCDGCLAAYDNGTEKYHLSISAPVTIGTGNKASIELKLFPVFRVFHRVISIDHRKRGKVVMNVEHFFVQRPGKEYWPFAIDRDVMETAESFSELTPSELLRVAAVRHRLESTDEAKENWRLNMQAFVAEEILRGKQDRLVIHPMLLDEIKSPDPLVAAEAARLLVSFESDATEESLLAALSHNAAEVRRSAAVSLAVVGRKFGFETIRKAFRLEADIPGQWEARPEADLGAFEALSIALARTGGRKALPDLGVVLRQAVPKMTLTHRTLVDYTPGYRRYAAIEALESVHDPAVLGLLVEQLNSSNICGFVNTLPIVDRDRAVEILRRLTGEKFGYIADPVIDHLESRRAALAWKKWLQEDGERLMWDEKKSQFVINTALPRRNAEKKLEAEIEKLTQQIIERRSPARPSGQR